MLLVEQAARQADDVARLEAALDSTGIIVPGAAGQPRMNAIVTELRQARLALGRLLGMLALPADDDGDEGRVFTARSLHAQRAARVRWSRVEREREAREREAG